MKMGYDYFFLLSLVKVPQGLDDVDLFAEKIAEECKKFSNEDPNFPKTDEFGRTSDYSRPLYCSGDNGSLITSILNFAKRFPNVIFALYHVYYDCFAMDIYTFSDIELLKHEKINFEGTIGSYGGTLKIKMEDLFIPNNLTCSINPDYDVEGFEFNELSEEENEEEIYQIVM